MLSIIIPVLNEEDYIRPLLQKLTSVSDFPLEVIVVDGGSSDATLSIIKEFKQILTLKARKGRAFQMNEGAKKAQYNHLLFLHADTHLAIKLISKLPRLINKTEAGSFKLTFDKKGFWLNLYAWFTQWNWTIFTYGDQGLLISKRLFIALNGFKEIPILEDIDMIYRIKQKSKFTKFKDSLMTSARRFDKYGHVFQQLLNIGIVCGFYLRIKPEFLARFYRY